ncbi:hypothetical protein DKX38_005796 [Salix brachista]|uniref:Uncharacterized protein n=1 Tax=Salix brachista TaxID=2182728 RepID=A0A5N5N0N3_9ROSI|nr:hypothetical protein DKX38_005796 [Salix brachista]
MFTQWGQSHPDLPLMVYVTRWEMRAKPFARILEFLWQEGHTAHASPSEAENEMTSNYHFNLFFLSALHPSRFQCRWHTLIVPIWRKEDGKTGVLNAASSVKETLQSAGIKVKLGDMDQRTPGWKLNFREMKWINNYSVEIKVGGIHSMSSIILCLLTVVMRMNRD